MQGPISVRAKSWAWSTLIFVLGLFLIWISEKLSHLPVEIDMYGYRQYVVFLFHEIGVGFIVASIVWVLFERLSHAKAEKEWQDRVKIISENVFFGVLGKNLPEKLISTTKDLVLHQKLIRENLKIDYDIQKSYPPDCAFILSTTLGFVMSNITEATVPFKFQLSISTTMIGTKKSLIKIKSAHFLEIGELNDTEDGGSSSLIDLVAKNKELQKQISSQKEGQISLELQIVEIPAMKKLYFEVRYEVPKNGYDDEIFETYFPVSNATVTIRFNKTDIAGVSVRAIHQKKIKLVTETEGGNCKIYHLPYYMLPHQALVTSWQEVRSK